MYKRQALIRGIKELGYLVKLDTNGYRPAILKSLVEKGLLDYVAMDIKAGRARYGEVAGRPGLDIGLIGESADFLLHGTLDFEFRTTVEMCIRDRSQNRSVTSVL